MTDVQAVSSVGKYLHRHWPQLSDHMIRDAAALGEAGEFKILDTLEGIICGVEFGPQSCMKSSYGSIPFGKDATDTETLMDWIKGDLEVDVPWDRHPYYVYQPEYGWKMAVITSPKALGEHGPNVETYQSRALLLDTAKHKCFVRTYQRPTTAGAYSEASHRLDALLTAAGYTKRNSWPSGAQIAKVEHPDDHYANFMVPYIDGGDQTVDDMGDHLRITCDGEYDCTNTDGTPSESNRNYRECDDCGHTEDEDSDTWHWVSRHGDHCVCENCLSDYVTVMRQGNHGTVEFMDHTNNSDVVEIVDSYGDHTGTYLWECSPPSGYIHTEEGWCVIDDAVQVTDGDWYPRNYSSSRITVVELERECPDTGASYALESDAVERDGKWYSEHDDLSDLDEDEDEDEPAPPPSSVASLVAQVREVDSAAADWILANWATFPMFSVTATSLWNAMPWGSTPQGHAYWYNIAHKLDETELEAA
jgi:hypothetical protein